MHKKFGIYNISNYQCLYKQKQWQIEWNLLKNSWEVQTLHDKQLYSIFCPN